jgi:hypothetical protein
VKNEKEKKGEKKRVERREEKREEGREERREEKRDTFFISNFHLVTAFVTPFNQLIVSSPLSRV